MKQQHKIFMLIGTFALLNTASASAGFLDSIFNNNKNDGILVQNSSDPKVIQSNQAIVLKGTLKTLDDISITPKSFTQKIPNEIEIRTYFPDFTSEKTNATQFSSKRDTYQLTTPPLTAPMNYQLITTVGKSSPECRSMLSLQSKLERRVNEIDSTIARLKLKGYNDRHLTPWLKLRSLLVLFAGKIDSHLATKYQDMTETRYALQFENGQSASSSASVLGNGFRIKIESSPGNVFKNDSVTFTTNVKYIGDVTPHKNDRYDIEYRWNGVKIAMKENIPLTTSTDISFPYTVPNISTAGTFEIRVYEKKQILIWKQRDLVSFLPFSPILLEDSVPPTFNLTNVTPNSSNAFVKNVDPIYIEISDSFGRLDPSTFKATLTGTHVHDLSAQLTKTKVSSGEKYIVSGAIPQLDEGSYQFKFEAKDFSENAAVPYTTAFVVDRTSPSITLGSNDGVFTRQPQFSLPVTVLDASPVTTIISLNGIQIKSSTDLSFASEMNLNEGMNIIDVSAYDAAGNTSRITLSNIVLDSTPPTLSNVLPGVNSIVNNTTVPVSGQSSERLSYARANNQELRLSSDQKSFSGNFTSMITGPTVIHLEVADIAGNISTREISITINISPLNGNLVSIFPKTDGEYLDIVGAPGAALPGIIVKAKASLFNSDSTTANSDGSFRITLPKFQSVTVSAETNGQSSSVTLTWGTGGTLLSGVVKDVDGTPLPGARVRFQTNTTVSTIMTDASGVFAFTQPVTGDQKLEIDGRFISNGKQYSKTLISVRVGIGHHNVLPRPIYLVPIETNASTIQVNTGGSVVSSVDAKARLNIPPNSTQFLNGSNQGKISITPISAELATISPMNFAKTDKVFALEPSGVSFSQPATLTLPNDNNLPSGTQMVVMSMNSSTGKWELDGIGKVDESGSTITTLPGQGITHFSAVYFSPVLTQPQAIDGNGNSSSATLARSISLPSYKSNGQTITPQLLYNSVWAKPTALVSNLFDLSPLKIEAQSESGIKKYAVSRCFLFVCIGGDDIYWQSKTKAEAWYQPNRIDAQFSTAIGNSEAMSFKGNPLLPARSVISYMADLKYPQSSQYMEAGAHAYSAKYTLHLDHISVTTRTIEAWKANETPIISTESLYQDEQIAGVFPSDLHGRILVENERNSSAGMGWKIGGVQRISNPTANTIVIQEGDGTQSSYAVNNTMNTLWTAAPIPSPFNPCTSGDCSNYVPYLVGANLSHWPYLVTSVYTAKTMPGLSYPFKWHTLKRFDLSNNNSSTDVGDLQDIYSNDPRLPFDIGGTVTLSNGTTFVTRPDRNAITQVFPGYGNVIAGRSGRPGFDGDGNISESPDGRLLNSPTAIIPGPRDGTLVFADSGNYLVRMIDLYANTITTIAGNGGPVPVLYDHLATESPMEKPLALAYDNLGNLFIATNDGEIHKVDTTGMLRRFAGGSTRPVADRSTAETANFDAPKGLLVDNENGYLYVADTNHDRVVRINFNTMIAETVAGGGTSGDDGLPGLQTKLNKPTSLGFDSNHNLLIADSQSSKVRRLTLANDSLGKLTFNSSSDSKPGVRQNANGSWVPYLERNNDGTFTRNYRDGSRANFDSSGYQIDSIDRVGNQTIYTYDNSGNLTSMRDPTGGILTYSYSSGMLKSITDPAGRTTQLAFNGDRTLAQIKFSDGTAKNYIYNNEGLMTAERDQNGSVTSYQYNGYERLNSVTLPNQSVIQVTDSASMTAINNAMQNQIAGAQDFGTTVGSASDSVMDVNGNKTTYVKNYHGYIETVVDALGNTTEIETDLKGKPQKVTYPDGTTKSFTYNEWDDVTSTNESEIVKRQTFDNYGNKLTESDGKNHTTIYDYDSQTGLLLSKTDSLNHQSIYTYNPAGLITTATNYLGQTTKFEYDAFGNVIKITNPLLQASVRTYDSAGNVTSITDANGRLTKYEHDAFNRLVSVTTSNDEKTTYTYLPGGQLSTITDPLGGITTNEYDSLGNMIKKTDPTGNSYVRSYDSNGNVTSETDPNGNVKVYQYDALNNLVKKILPDNVISMTYNFRKHPTSMKDANSEIIFEYDSFGRLIASSIRGLNHISDYPYISLAYELDENGNRVAMTAPQGRTSYIYDGANRPLSIKNPLNEIYSYAYNEENGDIDQSRPGGLTVFKFDANRNVRSITHSSNNATTVSYQYARDSIGNIIQSVMQRPQKTINRNIAYDANYQVTRSSNPESSISSYQNETFAYDEVNNRTADQNGSYNYDNNSRRLREDYLYSYFYDNNGNLIKKVSKSDLTEFSNYVYSSENQLLEIKFYKGNASTPIKEVRYSYDAIGRRIQKIVVDQSALTDPKKTFTRRYGYDGASILLEFDGNNHVLAQYTNSTTSIDNILSVNITDDGVDAKLAQSAGSYMFLRDSLGSVVDITDANGNQIQHYIYSAFGKLLEIQNTQEENITANPTINTTHTFAGRELDSETGYYYNRARYFDPSIGRFLQEDSHPGKLGVPMSVVNAYIYSANNPWNISDPSGQSWLGDLFTGILIGVASFFTGGLAGALFASAILSTAAGALAGAITGILIGGISNLLQGRSFASNILGNALTGALFGAFGGLSSNANWALNNFDPKNGVRLAQVDPGGQVVHFFGDTYEITWSRVYQGIAVMLTGALIGVGGAPVWVAMGVATLGGLAVLTAIKILVPVEQ